MERIALQEEIRRAITRLKQKRAFIAVTKSIPDTVYLQMRARFKLNRRINFENPKRFNDKLQWMKCFDRSSLRSDVADKLRVRQFVEERAEGLLKMPAIIQIYAATSQISFNDLPKRFVLKANHGSGMNLLIDGKERPPVESVQALASAWMNLDYHYLGREYHYQTQRRVYVEEYLGDGSPPKDYKFYCFKGRVRFIQVDLDRYGMHRRIMLSPDWTPAGFDFIYPPPDQLPAKPPCVDAMIDAAERLALPFNFIRVDLYELDGEIYFGELTNFPESGYGKFIPDDVDFELGELLELDGTA